MIVRFLRDRTSDQVGHSCRSSALSPLRRRESAGPRGKAEREGRGRAGSNVTRQADRVHRSVIAAGAVSPSDLAHTLSVALALPLLDLTAVDPQKLPKNVIDSKLAAQYQVVVLGKRGNRIFIGGADPTDQEAAERIKFATQLSPEWVIVEHDKLSKILESSSSSANETMEALSSGDFEFDVTDDVTAPAESQEVSSEVEDAPVVRFLQKMLIDAINLRASDLHFEPYEYHYRVRFRVDGELREITQPP